MSEIPAKRARTDEKECRACLTKLNDDSGFVDIFRAWDPAWSGMGLSIAEDLAKLTNIEINVSQQLSNIICTTCCCRLQDAIMFTMDVQTNDRVLRDRHKDSVDENPQWPKPIQVDKNITSNALNEMTVEVKQEVLTEDEYESNEQTNEPYNEDVEPNLDIKIEPEEITPAIPSGPYSLQTEQLEAEENGVPTFLDENSLEDVKDEPMSEDDAEPPSDMPKDCMLCFKTFHTVKGLKAHVIAVHSYDTVTSARVDRPHVCTTCNRSFSTRTDLFVHETCHDQYVCYVCDMKFDTFHLLTKHRSKQCTKTSVLPRLKTLDDVRRPIYYIIPDKKKSSTILTGTEKMSEEVTSSQIKKEETNLASNDADHVEGKLGQNEIKKEQIKRTSAEQSEIMNNVEQLMEKMHRETETIPDSSKAKTKSCSTIVAIKIEISKEKSQSDLVSMKNVIEGKLNSLANGSVKQESNEIHEELGNESIDSNSCENIKQSAVSHVKVETFESNSITDKSENVDESKKTLSEDIKKIKDNELTVTSIIEDEIFKDKTDVNLPEAKNVKKEIVQETTTVESICEIENSLESEEITQQHSVESCVKGTETISVQKNDENDKNIENLELKLPMETTKANLIEDMKIQTEIHSSDEAMDIDLEREIKNVSESDKLTS